MSPWFQRRVGAVTIEGAAELGKQGIDVSDAIVRDLNIPIMQQALDLLDTVYAIADELGVGPEVRAAVTALRGAQYAGAIAATVLPPSAVATGGAVFASLGGMAALGAVAVVGVVLLELLGGSDDEEAKKRTKRAQAAVLHLRDRLTLAEFAAEQEATAASGWILSLLPIPAVANEGKAQWARASKLGAFYRAAAARLPSADRALFESLSNLGRWQATLVAYAKLPASKRDAVDVMFGKSEPRLPYQLAPKIKAETDSLSGAVARARGGAAGGLVALLAFAALAGAGLYVASPAAFGAALHTLKSGASAAGTYVAKVSPL